MSFVAMGTERGGPRAGSTPERTLAQRREALRRANGIRSKRAQLKKDLKDGNVRIHGLLASPPDYVRTAKVWDLLVSVPSLGPVKVTRILTQCRVSANKTVGGLSERQQRELIVALRQK